MNRWNQYFYDIANTVASNSQCLSRKIGAILVRDKSIIATGYNGPARGIQRCDTRTIKRNGEIVYTNMDDGKCPRYTLGYKSGEGLDICIAAHAEVNCIANAARHGVICKDAIMYMTCEVPCKNCMAIIINAGITDLVVTKIKFYDDMTKDMVNKSHIGLRDFEDNFYLRWKEKGR
jgi:dCMP deaminase